MSDSSDNDVPPESPVTPEDRAVAMEVAAQQSGAVPPLGQPAAARKAPPKPASRPSIPMPRSDGSPLRSRPPPPASVPPPPAAAVAPPPPALRPRDDPAPSSEGRGSIRPTRMIKLGDDRRRTEPPPSAVERPSRPPPVLNRAEFEELPAGDETPAIPPPLPDTFDSVPPPAAAPGPILPVAPPEPAFAASAGGEEAEQKEPHGTTSDPNFVAVDPDYEDATPPRAIPKVSKPPPPPSARAKVDSSPDIEVDVATEPEPADAGTEPERLEMRLGERPTPDVEPPSDRDSITEAEPISIDAHGLAEESRPPPRAPVSTPDETRDSEKQQKKPPPPPKRAKPLPPADSVAQALEPPKFDPATKPRAKPWWEELFTDDFARGILPLKNAQIRREVDFIEESLGVAKGGVVLDLACGAGQHAVELSSRGYGVVGFDLSLPQLALAGEYAQERGQKINFLQGDMRDMSFDTVFDGVYCWDTSFGYFEEDKNVLVAERVFKALRPGGNFLLDVINRDFVTQHQPSQVWFEGDACVCMDDMSVDFITSRLRVKRTLMLDDGRTRECAFSIRVYSLHELGKMLHEIGFRVIEASGRVAHPGVFFGATSPRVLILAQKP